MAIVNKVAYDFTSLEFDFTIVGGKNLGIVEGIEELDYSEKYNREKLKGTSAIAIARTDGDVDSDASVTFLEAWMRFILDSIKELKVARRDFEFNLTINYQNKGEALHTDTIVGCKFAELGRSFSRGPAGLMVKCPLDVMNIFMDGVDPLGNQL